MSDLREIPGVDALLQTRAAAALIAEFGRPLVVEALRFTLGELRRQAQEGKKLPERAVILQRAREALESWVSPALVPVINASGVILHTNLGRAPLSKAALQAMVNAAAGYSTLEYNLETGERGSRGAGVERLLTRLSGAEAALVVNNNAAAVLLALTALVHRKRVIISRTQLVEIGGGFRLPEVMSQSGAKLVEVGATNRVHPADYEAALQEPAGLLLHAHSSNFRILGFTSEVSIAELVRLGSSYGVAVLDDLGSGALIDTARFGLAHEPMVQESLAAGADVVCFSGDKLLGGPQSGILLGRGELLAKIRRHPLARAVRADKLCLAALSATLRHYLCDEVEREIPVWQMITRTIETLHARAQRWVEDLKQGEVLPGRSTIGGGSLPGETLPTFLLALRVPQPNRFLARLRGMTPPVIGRVEEDRAVFDPRTVLPEEEGALLVCLQNALGGRI